MLSRRELHHRVWTAPVRTVAAELGISDVGLKKLCQKADIPVPKRGYWAKLKAGHPAMATSLPRRGPGIPDEIHVRKHELFGLHRGGLEEELARPAPVEPRFDETIEDLRHRVATEVGKVSSERTLKAPHPLVRRVLTEQEKRQRLRNVTWSASAEPDFSSAYERRRLRVLSSIFTALDRFGAHPWIQDPEARKTGAAVGSMSVSFLLDHPAAKPDHNGSWRTREGWADELRLSIADDKRRAWSDTEEHGLETHLSAIVVEVIVAGELNYRASAIAAYERSLSRRRELEAELVRQREEVARKAREAEIAAEKERRTQLLKMATDLRAADDIRSLVARVLARDSGDHETASHWAEWALNVAEQLDPTGRNLFGPPEA